MSISHKVSHVTTNPNSIGQPVPPSRFGTKKFEVILVVGATLTLYT